LTGLHGDELVHGALDQGDVQVLVETLVVDGQRSPVRGQRLVGLVVVEQVGRGTFLARRLQHEGSLECHLVVDDEAAVVEVERVGAAVLLTLEGRSLSRHGHR
jgi:hypothetical protein